VNDLFVSVEKPTQAPIPITVSEVSRKIQAALEGRIGRIDVIGQLNSPNFRQHWYFALTDGEAKIDCVMWASRVSSNNTGQYKNWIPKQGDQVIIRGTVGHYSQSGRTQIYVERMKPVGDEKGKLQLEYEALLQEFREAGWFDEEHKKQLPNYPRRIAVITSSSSAAVQDVIETSRQRMPSVELLIINVPVQGDESAPAVKEALERVDHAAESLGIDAIIVTRGGGPLEDLWSFNDRGVVEAAFHCQTPIVAAIGHESDTSIIELVADLRASTPTQAAMVLVPDREELVQMVTYASDRLLTLSARAIECKVSEIQHLQQKLQIAIQTQLNSLTLEVAAKSELLATRRPHKLIQARQGRLLTLKASLSRAILNSITVLKQEAMSLDARLESIGPMEVLRRGFSLTQGSSGTVVRSSKDVQEGENIRTVLADGTIESKVECTS
jgi:exodeoxyribonuclease VII large subunit